MRLSRAAHQESQSRNNQNHWLHRHNYTRPFHFETFSSVSIVSAPSRRRSALPLFIADARASETKKADVAEHPQVFDHVGLLIDGPPGLSRVAPHLVLRRFVRLADCKVASCFGDARDGNRGESEAQADQGKTVDS